MAYQGYVTPSPHTMDRIYNGDIVVGMLSEVYFSLHLFLQYRSSFSLKLHSSEKNKVKIVEFTGTYKHCKSNKIWGKNKCLVVRL